ncbi:hypothetical protein RQP46_002105 [Phenoliferia psychrophenolica]
MLKLRLSNNVRATFPLFSAEVVGTMAKSFFGLVSGSRQDPRTQDSFGMFSQPYRAPQSTRFLYELAFQTQKASRAKSPGAVRIVQESMTAQLWRRFPAEIVSLATAGIPSSYDSNLEEPLFVRLLKEDESTTLDYPPSRPLLEDLEDPLANLSPGELHHWLSVWFVNSPYCFFLNDALTLAAVTSGTHDRALISILVGIAISLKSSSPPGGPCDSPPPSPLPFFTSHNEAGGLPPSVFEIGAPPRTFRLLDHRPFIEYGQQLLFSRPVEEAARSIESVQALLLLGVFVGSEHRTRESWAIMSSGYAIARESLKRIQEMGERERLRRTERESVEDEALINVVWMFAIFGSWSFLSLDLPRSTLIDLTDSLPLPPFTHHESRSYTYRSTTTLPNISACDSALQKGIRGFNETCRTLALVVTLSIKNGLHATEVNARPPGDSRTFEYPLVADARLANLSIFTVMVAKWLVQTAEEHVAPETAATRRRAATSASGRVAPSEGVVVSAAGLRLAIRAIELLVEGSRPKVLQAIQDGGNGKVLPESAKTGLLRLLGDALPHCLRLMDHLAVESSKSTEVYSTVFEEHVRIAKVLEDLIFLTDSGLTTAGNDSTLGARRVQHSLSRVRSPSPSTSLATSIPLSPPDEPAAAPTVRVPPPPTVPFASHFRSLSSDSSLSFSPYPTPPNRHRSGSSSSLSVHSGGGGGGGGRSRSGSSSSLLSDRGPVHRVGRGRSDSGFESLTVPSPSSFSFSMNGNGSTAPCSIPEVLAKETPAAATGLTFEPVSEGGGAGGANSWSLAFATPEWSEVERSADSSPAAHGPPTLLSLPNEILDLIFEQPDIGPVKPLRLVSKRFNLMARRCGVLSIVGDDEAWVDSLFKTGGIKDVRQVLYTTPDHHQITLARTLALVSSLTDVEINPAENDETWVLSKYTTDALKCLPNLKRLKLNYFNSVEDKTFRVANGLPSLRHLILHDHDRDIASLFREPCSLQSLHITAIILPSIKSCLEHLHHLSVHDYDGKGDAFLSFGQLAEACADKVELSRLDLRCGSGALFSPELAHALAAVFKFTRDSKARHLNIIYWNKFFSTPSKVPDSLPQLSSVRTLTLESTYYHNIKDRAAAADILGALVKFLKLFSSLGHLTLHGWFGQGDSWNKMTPRRLATLPYFELYVESEYTNLLLAVIRASTVHVFVARFWNSAESVRFLRRPGTTEEFERERFSTKMKVQGEKEVDVTVV